MSETSIASARASVMIYDDNNKKWIPSGTSSGLSKVHIFKHLINNTFRIVGRKLQDHEVVINCVILKSLKYNQATITFHQWRDSKHVYGLNFSSKEDADTFAKAMIYALEVLDTLSKNNHNYIPSPVYQQTNAHFEEQIGYRTMTKEDISVIQDNMSHQNIVISSTNGCLPTQSQQTNHFTSSAPKPPPLPGLNLSPPQPPPLPGSLQRPSSNGDQLDPNEVISDQTSSLAVQLQAARLKRTNKHPTENSGSSLSSCSSGSSGNYGTLNRNANGNQSVGIAASMMNEMARTLARRRAAVEKKTPNDCSQVDESLSSVDKKNLNRNDNQKNSFNDCESPKLGRKLLSTVSTEDIASKSFGDDYISIQLQTLKQDILLEIRNELNRMKLEIIESVKLEISKR